ncbi:MULTISPECIES: hypothetical protein [unclassified Nocardia]|uniref:hypothetical protein n=1 Tax=unclassified Nocardia TaxID=2637762 RepID=UPI00278C5FF4|nr:MULTISPECIES: hypothetical protein [unclassified Nocardia]
MTVVDYPVSLAVEDFVPVLLTTAGVLLLGHRGRHSGTPPLPHRAHVIAAAALIGTAGFAKASAKLVAALDGPDLPWLSSLLFPLLTLGFGWLCLQLGRESSEMPPRWLMLLVPGLTICCGIGALLARDPLPMLVSTTVFATIVGVNLITRARARGDTAAAALFGTQLLGFFILGPLAARPDQTVTLQWIEQLSNTAAQAAFLIACWRLTTHPAAEPADHEAVTR